MSIIVQSSLALGIIHLCIDKSFETKHSNVMTCAISQCYFTFTALNILFLAYFQILSTNNLIENTLFNVQFLIGYFLYDSIYIIMCSPSIIFLFHHIIGIIFCILILRVGIPTDMIITYNLLCVVMEGNNPYLNFRTVLKGTCFEKINKYIIVISYTLFRMIGYPIVYLNGMKKLEEKNILSPFQQNFFYWKFYIIYFMSVVWYRKILYFLK